MAIRGNPWQSVAIRGNHWQSGVLDLEELDQRWDGTAVAHDRLRTFVIGDKREHRLRRCRLHELIRRREPIDEATDRILAMSDGVLHRLAVATELREG